jgi:hypothetical protein
MNAVERLIEIARAQNDALVSLLASGRLSESLEIAYRDRGEIERIAHEVAKGVLRSGAGRHD